MFAQYLAAVLPLDGQLPGGGTTSSLLTAFSVAHEGPSGAAAFGLRG